MMTDEVSSLLLQAVTRMQQQQPRVSDNPAGSQSALLSEHRRLFGRRRAAATERQTAENPVAKKRKTTRTWSHQFCALANKTQLNVPKRDESTKLTRGGLGTRQLTFQSDDTSSAVNEIILSDEQDPVALLRAFQRKIMYGRPLNLTSLEGTIEGQTVPMYVDRQSLITTAFDELMNIFSDGCDFRKPLDVTFYAEQAVDLGGPRLEFLTLCLKLMLNEDVGIFDKTDDGFTISCRESLLEKKYYFLAGLVCGISVIQGGPMPSFMNPDFVDNLVLSSGTEPTLMTRSEEQFSEGLNVLGLLDVMKRKPPMLFLLRSSCEQPVSFRKLLLLLNPVFSDIGSNMRTRENEAYRVFVSYVREVSAGRRPPVTLGKILKFVTACETEPLLGFTMQPSLVFQDDLSIPRANTCCCALRIPLLTSVYNLELLDLAFTSDYFGYV